MFYKLDLLKEQLNNIAALTKTSITIYDINMAAIIYSDDYSNPVCNTIRDCSLKTCLLSDNFAKANSSITEPYSYTCPGGFTETIIPLLDNKYTYGYCIVGQYRLETNLFPEEFFREFCNKYNLSLSNLKEQWMSTASYAQKEIRALISVVQVILQYSKERNILGSNHSELFACIDEFINTNLDKPITIESLSENFYLSKQQLYLLFRENVQQTVKSYINNKRLDKAKSLMLHTENPLPIIAESVGFNDFNYFIKKFKAREHCTPKQFKLLSKKNS